MNRELVDYYNQNNYDLFGLNANRNVCQTILDTYPAINRAVCNYINAENQFRNRKMPSCAWVSTFFFLFFILKT